MTIAAGTLPDDIVAHLRANVEQSDDCDYCPRRPSFQARVLLEKYVPEAKRERLLEEELRQVKAALHVADRKAVHAETERVKVVKVNQDRGKQINTLSAKLKAAMAAQHSAEVQLRGGG